MCRNFPLSGLLGVLVLAVSWSDEVLAENAVKTSRSTFDPVWAMWVAAVVAGLILLFMIIIILVVSTIVVRYYERTRLTRPPVLGLVNIAPLEGSGPPGLSAFNGISTFQTTSPPGKLESSKSEYVYYNRGMDTDGSTLRLDSRQSGVEISVL